MYRITKLSKMTDEKRIKAVRAALKRSKNNVVIAAKDVGLSVSQTYRYMRKYELARTRVQKGRGA